MLLNPGSVTLWECGLRLLVDGVSSFGAEGIDFADESLVADHGGRPACYERYAALAERVRSELASPWGSGV